MKIAVDAMGGDFAPRNVIDGSILAACEYGYEIILVGEECSIKKELARHKKIPSGISIKHASEIIGMDEPPAVTIRKKKDSSINVAVNLLKQKKADAMFTAGNTGAMVCSATLKLRTLEAVDRPGISVVLPTMLNSCLLIDIGANIACKPEHLFQYAVMGSVYCRYVLAKKQVRVGLLSIGEEKSKGNELIKLAHGLLSKSNLNFIGNVEGKDIFSGRADVIVCDGFTGNIILKVLESVAETVTGLFKQQLSSNLLTMIGGLLSMPAFRSLKRKVDYAEHGGAPLLGIDGICIVGHGRSSSKAIKNGIRVAAEAVLHDINQHIIDSIKDNHV